MLKNKKLKFLSEDVYIKVTNNKNKFCKNYNTDQILKLNIAHNEGNYFTDNNHIKELEDNNLIVFKYCSSDGKIGNEFNPNGSLNNIAGILNKEKNILGMMPHPERMIDNIVSNDDGIALFSSLLKQ